MAAVTLQRVRRAIRRRAAAAHARRVRLIFSYPSIRRVNLTVVYDGAREEGPFAVRAVLIDGRLTYLTRDSVDGQPDGEDPSEVIAPMRLSPAFGDNVHRVAGDIGIEGLRAEPSGVVEVEIIDRLGRTCALSRRRI